MTEPTSADRAARAVRTGRSGRAGLRVAARQLAEAAGTFLLALREALLPVRGARSSGDTGRPEARGVADPRSGADRAAGHGPGPAEVFAASGPPAEWLAIVARAGGEWDGESGDGATEVSARETWAAGDDWAAGHDPAGDPQPGTGGGAAGPSRAGTGSAGSVPGPSYRSGTPNPPVAGDPRDGSGSGRRDSGDAGSPGVRSRRPVGDTSDAGQVRSGGAALPHGSRSGRARIRPIGPEGAGEVPAAEREAGSPVADDAEGSASAAAGSAATSATRARPSIRAVRARRPGASRSRAATTSAPARAEASGGDERGDGPSAASDRQEPAPSTHPPARPGPRRNRLTPPPSAPAGSADAAARAESARSTAQAGAGVRSVAPDSHDGDAWRTGSERRGGATTGGEASGAPGRAVPDRGEGRSRPTGRPDQTVSIVPPRAGGPRGPSGPPQRVNPEPAPTRADTFLAAPPRPSADSSGESADRGRRARSADPTVDVDDPLRPLWPELFAENVEPALPAEYAGAVPRLWRQLEAGGTDFLTLQMRRRN